MDVSRRSLADRRSALVYRTFGLAAILLLGLVLRLKGVHDPLLDHPGWRQGDTAAIARNFATLDFNIVHPQTDYDGPPPNYVELELQIVPFLAAMLYKVFGVHEIFGRLISIGFSLGTIGLVYAFARWLWASTIAGYAAALALALAPGSVYYGRTFMPDTAMVFFLTLALYVTTRYLTGPRVDDWRALLVPAALTALALLAKPVAIVALVPIAAVSVQSLGWKRTLRRPQTYAFLGIVLLPLLAYDRYVASIAEWHWASGITQLHVLPALRMAFSTPAAFWLKLVEFKHALQLLSATMLGPLLATLFLIAIVVTLVWRVRSASSALLYGWLAGALVYAYVVVTVERVDYYLYLVLPLAALWIGGFTSFLAAFVPANATLRAVALTGAALTTFGAYRVQHQAVLPYYRYDKAVYAAARQLDATLAPGSLVVMGHYDPSVLYYINRKGWEEDPYLWTPFDEQSAIAKGARYFIAVEPRRFARNVELYAWMQRFPTLAPPGKWPVYQTDYANVLPGAEERWRKFRDNEKQHRVAPGAPN